MPRRQLHEHDFGTQVACVAETFGAIPLEGTGIPQSQRLQPKSETVLAIAIDAMLKSRPISHHLAHKTTCGLIDHRYHLIDTLANSTWEDRVQTLRQSGYNRYREQCATNLGNLAELVNNKYDGDLNQLLEGSHGHTEEIQRRMKEIKGIGDLGAELFLDQVHSVWPSVAPFLDSRSLKTAEEIGIGTDLDAIYDELGQDSVSMSKFASGLSKVRLEHKEHDIQAL
ncbi:hypothetical protein N7462_004787 [Penicillium macrosclerotiorum]|uniref:uncharacterized protein n=1 Tax=Penicillium macrosclerotiorum TaxID=303699 RepID=UPI002546E09A|nr:uncharacterized protein N7462_004787 [Penicillium macrosclerotiorum]KAJ5690395.1 hypothetical protein N7462_004787 [Penicillium macrosclerotiorum]